MQPSSLVIYGLSHFNQQDSKQWTAGEEAIMPSADALWMP